MFKIHPRSSQFAYLNPTSFHILSNAKPIRTYKYRFSLSSKLTVFTISSLFCFLMNKNFFNQNIIQSSKTQLKLDYKNIRSSVLSRISPLFTVIYNVKKSAPHYDIWTLHVWLLCCHIVFINDFTCFI